MHKHSHIKVDEHFNYISSVLANYKCRLLYSESLLQVLSMSTDMNLLHVHTSENVDARVCEHYSTHLLVRWDEEVRGASGAPRAGSVHAARPTGRGAPRGRRAAPAYRRRAGPVAATWPGVMCTYKLKARPATPKASAYPGEKTSYFLHNANCIYHFM